MSEQRPCILLTNDDGIHAPGLKALQTVLHSLGEIYIVAPLNQRSAVSHGITIGSPLEVHKVIENGTLFGFGVAGTPADCVKLALGSLLDRVPELVISGINLGPNTGTNIFYSGTVSAAIEAVILGIPALAISLTTFSNPNFKFASFFTQQIARRVLHHGLPSRCMLNINIPAVPSEEIRGVGITVQGHGRYQDYYVKDMEEGGIQLFHLEGEEYFTDSNPLSDDQAILANRISITPLSLSLLCCQNYDRFESSDFSDLLLFDE